VPVELQTGFEVLLTASVEMRVADVRAVGGQIPIAYARRHVMLGLAESDSAICLAIGCRESWAQLDVARRILGRNVEPLFAPPEEVQRVINIAYQQRTGEAQTLIESLDRSDVLADLQSLAGLMRSDSIAKILRGATTVDEVSRVTVRTS
jgi:hypothetical protein